MKRLDAQKGEYDERIAIMMASMEAHIIADAKAFDLIAKQLIETNKDVKDLLLKQKFTSGMWKAVAVIGGGLTTIIGLALLALQVLQAYGFGHR